MYALAKDRVRVGWYKISVLHPVSGESVLGTRTHLALNAEGLKTFFFF